MASEAPSCLRKRLKKKKKIDRSFLLLQDPPAEGVTRLGGTQALSGSQQRAKATRPSSTAAGNTLKRPFLPKVARILLDQKDSSRPQALLELLPDDQFS